MILVVLFARQWGAERSDGPLDLRPSEFIRMLRFGLPSGLNWFLEFAALLVFVDVMGMQQADAARLLGRSTEGAKKRIQRSRQRLRTLLGNNS